MTTSRWFPGPSTDAYGKSLQHLDMLIGHVARTIDGGKRDIFTRQEIVRVKAFTWTILKDHWIVWWSKRTFPEEN